ncbi:preprotein translocase subunit SecE [Novosphingobium sp.]|uniref:preprotein translocase subunit SecE n=1 Tax=Novosphingobium sp. TaxID=1874826 RepID=UPI001EBFD748|nr:preprotein translocase subunit SecE [Novosphingobium sp.]MBK6800233.1 preprotein translocase subunit SecE [Novosphingobium sp.]MBK9010750.1 preprotein translocase subunit SecE [Novosphingobium sp.]
MAKINPGEFMRQVQAEARKVVWPSRQETVTTAIFVGIMMVLLAVFFLGIDSLFGWVVRQLLSLA